MVEEILWRILVWGRLYLRWAFGLIFNTWMMFGLFATGLLASNRDGASGCLAPLVLALLLVGSDVAAAFSIEQDRKREAAEKDNFTGGRLFFRYGDEIHRAIFSIKVGDSWSKQQVDLFAVKLRDEMASRLAARLSCDRCGVSAVAIRNSLTGSEKIFLRILATTPRGSLVAHFAHYAPFQNTITAHYFTFARGTVGIPETILWVLEAPYRIWFWGIPWLLNRYSVLSEVSDFRNDSYDLIDLQTMYMMISDSLLRVTADVLRDEGLLTEELQTIIVNQLFSAQQVNIGGPRSQFLNVSVSGDSSVGNVSQEANVNEVGPSGKDVA